MPVTDQELTREAYAQALLNAVQHKGEPSVQAVIGKILAAHPDLRAQLNRVSEAAEEACSRVSGLSHEGRIRELEAYSEYLPDKPSKTSQAQLDLQDIPGRPEKVVTRFSPNPDGPLHLGNLRAAVLSYKYAKKYGGIFILRFEDTDPKVKPPILEAYQWIRDDLQWLGLKWDHEYVQSDRIEIYYEYARKLVQADGAYVCECDRELFSRLKASGQNCPHRNRVSGDSLILLESMVRGEFDEEKAVLRLKTSQADPNPALRDPALMRIIDTKLHPHPRLGSKYSLFPLYNFSTAIDDSLMGVTLVFRGKEHQTNSLIQNKIQQKLGLSSPLAVQYGRLQLEGYVLSKSQIRSAITTHQLDSGLTTSYNGWDDPRLATVVALRRRGITAEALVNLMLEVGAKPIEARISWDNLASVNRKIIEPIAKRYFAVTDPVIMEIEGVPGDRLVATIPNHPGKPDEGTRKVEIPVVQGTVRVLVSGRDTQAFTQGKTVRLMDLVNVTITSMKTGSARAKFISTSVGDIRETKPSIIQWVKEGEGLPMKLYKAFGMNMNMDAGIVESSILREPLGSEVQLVRIGYARIDTLSENGANIIYTHD
ncbi:MAG: glutamate--tRNA ligase [Candidatus Marsarchaeota archaeon]|nr:glutamate--tRNA ligase [Candidatus Marsarchaeota archaeon]